MTRSRRLLWVAAAILAVPSLSGCAAVLPLAAAGALGKTTIDVVRSSRERRAGAAAEQVKKREAADNTRRSAELTLDGTRRARLVGGDLPGQADPASSPPTLATSSVASTSTVASASTGQLRTPWARMAAYVFHQREARAAGQALRGVVLAPGVSLAAPKFLDCGSKPLAVVVDLDQSGSDFARPLDPQSVAPTTTEAAFDIHSDVASVFWLSDRPASQGDAVRLALTGAGLWGESDRLLLADGTRKQERRWAAAKDHCVVAQLGDARGDMDELYDYLKTPGAAYRLEGLWNAGWFLAPATIGTET